VYYLGSAASRIAHLSYSQHRWVLPIPLPPVRFGDLDGIAQRVRDNLLDILPITKNCVALPLPSYGLKVVERHVGFERGLADFAGDISIAKYIEAVETEDVQLRDEIMDQILKYNQEDLEATWAVLVWLKAMRE